MSGKPRCFNRPDYHNSRVVLDGWREVTIGNMSFHVPVVKIAKNNMSKDCKQNEPMGAATMYGWDCGGCRHYASQK